MTATMTANDDAPPPAGGLSFEQVAKEAQIMGGVRFAIGALTAVAPGITSRLLWFPREQDNASARLVAGLFAVREMVLGAEVILAANDQQRLAELASLNLAVDAGDAVMALGTLVRRKGIPAASVFTLLPAVAGAAGWVRLKGRIAAAR